MITFAAVATVCFTFSGIIPTTFYAIARAVFFVFLLWVVIAGWEKHTGRNWRELLWPWHIKEDIHKKFRAESVMAMTSMRAWKWRFIRAFAQGREPTKQAVAAGRGSIDEKASEKSKKS